MTNPTSEPVDTLDVRPFMSEGGWSSTYRAAYRFAHASHRDYVRVSEQIESEERRLEAELTATNFPAEDLRHYVADLVYDLHMEAYRAAMSAQLFACMALEGFINAYGVRRLGESFYQRNIERIGITEKFALVGVCCNQWHLGEGSQVIRDLRDLFDARNRLVHPKTKEIRFDRISPHAYIHPSGLEVELNIQRLERCIDFLVEADPTLPRDFLFPKTLERLAGLIDDEAPQES